MTRSTLQACTTPRAPAVRGLQGAGVLLCFLAAGAAGAAAQEAAPAASPAPAVQAAPDLPSPAGGTAPAVRPATPSPGAAAPAPAPVAGVVPPPAGQVPADGTTAARLDACFMPPAKLAESDIADFLADPNALYAEYGGGFALSTRVRALAGSDSRTLDPLFRLASAANPDQKASIGAGLGRAAYACSMVAPQYSALIQSMTAGLGSPELLTAFLGATNDIQTASLGLGGGAGGGGAGGGGLAGGGLAGPGSAGLGGDEVVPTTVESFSIVGGGGRFTIRISSSVSPSNSD